MLDAYQTIQRPQVPITWEIFVKMSDNQESAGLDLANRFTRHHVRFQNSKMTVKPLLKLQTLSN